MSKFLAPGHGRLALQLGAAAAVAALLAGCSTDSTRLSDPFSNPFATASGEPAAPVAKSRPMGLGRQPPVVSQALPSRASSVASAAPLRPNLTRSASLQPVGRDVTGSIDPAATRSVRGASYGGWTSSGGVPVTVAQGETADVLSRRYGVPANVLLQTNGLGGASDLRPGATITIPVYSAVTAAHREPAPVATARAEAPAPREAAAPKAAPKLAKAALLKPRAERMAAAEQRKPAEPARPAPAAPAPAPAPAVKQAHVRPGAGKPPVEAAALAKPAVKKIEPKVAQAPVEKPSLRKGAASTKVAAQAAAPIEKRVAAKPEPAPAPEKVALAKPAPAAKPAPVKLASAAPPADVSPAPKVDAAPPAASPPPAAAGAPVADASGNPEFRWPARGRIIQGFKGGNDGINIAVPEGTAVKAAEGGTVAYAGSELKGYGNLVLIRHPNGYVTAYANNGEIDVKRGDQVKRGQVIAKSGQSGNVASPQLHFELRKGSTPVDPTSYLAGL